MSQELEEQPLDRTSTQALRPSASESAWCASAAAAQWRHGLQRSFATLRADSQALENTYPYDCLGAVSDGICKPWQACPVALVARLSASCHHTPNASTRRPPPLQVAFASPGPSLLSQQLFISSTGLQTVTFSYNSQSKRYF